MKAIGFVCEDCGALITARPDGPGRLQCPNCGGGVRRHLEQPAMEASLVGVAPSSAPTDQEDAPKEHPRELFHRMVPWLGSICLHAGAMLMLMFAVAQAVSPPTSAPRSTPPNIPGNHINDGIKAPVEVQQLTATDNTDQLFKRPLSSTDAFKPAARPTAQTPTGILDGHGSAGGGHDKVLVRTRKTPNLVPIAAIGSGQHVSIPGDKDFDPEGPGGVGIFAGTDIGDPPGPELVVGPVGPSSPGPIGRVDNVVFVIDQSGSVLSTFDQICAELVEYLACLKENQSFHVVFFAKDTFQESPARRLMPATDANRLDAARFLRGVHASGYGSCPIPALEAGFRALAAAPASEGKLLYLLTDGDFETSGHEYRSGGRVLRGNDAVVAWLRDHNANQAVQVNVVIVGDKPGNDTEACMRSIAKDNRGAYHYVQPK